MQEPMPNTSTVADSLTTVPPPAPIQVGSNGASGGYKFDPDQVQGVITQWKTLRDDLQTDLSNAEKIASVQPPGKEFASGDFINQGAGPSGDTLKTQHQRMFDYVSNYIDALEKASGQIQQGEDNAQQAAAQQGGGI